MAQPSASTNTSPKKSPRKEAHVHNVEHLPSHSHNKRDALLEAKKNLHIFWETCFLPFAGKELPPELQPHREKFESFEAFVGTCFEEPVERRHMTEAT